MPAGINRDRIKIIPVSAANIPQEYAPLFTNENVIGCFKGVRDYVIFTDVRIVSIDVQGLTGKQKVIVAVPYSQICEITIETSGYLDVDTDLMIRTTGGTAMAYSFKNGNDVVRIQSFMALKMK